VREVFDIDAKDKAEMERSDWLKFDGSLFGGGGDTDPSAAASRAVNGQSRSLADVVTSSSVLRSTRSDSGSVGMECYVPLGPQNLLGTTQ
jgi:hypothetical protein